MIPGQTVRQLKLDNTCRFHEGRECFHVRATVVRELYPGYGKWVVKNSFGCVRLLRTEEIEEVTT